MCAPVRPAPVATRARAQLKQGSSAVASPQGAGVGEMDSTGGGAGKMLTSAGGTGVCETADGERYSGAYAAGLPHGKGTYRFKNGNIYEGEYQDGKICGHGSIRFPDNRRFEGLSLSVCLSVCLFLSLSLPPSLPLSLSLSLSLSLLSSLFSLSLSEGAREREGMREGERAAVWRALCRHRFCKGGARGGDARECAGRWGPTEEFTCLLLLAISAADLPASPVPPQANSRTTRRTALDATRAPMVVCTVDVGSSSCL